MANVLARRVEKLEHSAGRAQDGSIIADDGAGGGEPFLGVRYAYRFDDAGSVLGLRVDGQFHIRRRGESVADLRRRALDGANCVSQLWEIVLANVTRSAGRLPSEYRFDSARWERQKKRLLAGLAADEARRRGEREWGERRISLTAIVVDHAQ